MKELNTSEAKAHFDDLLKEVQEEPVKITRNGKPVAVMMSKRTHQELEVIKERLSMDRLDLVLPRFLGQSVKSVLS